MEFIKPSLLGFTIYSKSGCHNCTKVKKLLNEKNLFFVVVDCDDYLVEDKNFFLSFIKSTVGKEHTTFPMVFYDNIFVGGFDETTEYVNKLMLSFEELF